MLKEAVEWGEAYGYRNAQVSVMAPTGTISLPWTAVPPALNPFSPMSFIKTVGRRVMTLTNPVIGQALINLGYTEAEVADIIAYIGREENGRVADGKIEGAPI